MVRRGATLTMTARANPLTNRATLPANALAGFVNGLRVLGYDTAALLAAAGLCAADLSDPDGQVPCESYGTILGRAQQQRFTPNLALALAQVTPLGAWPLLDYLVVTADTVGDGIRQLARYFRLTGNPVVLTVHDAADPIRVELAGSAPFAVEYNAALMVLHLRAETEGRFGAAGISLQHTIDDPAAFARVAGCPVAHNAAWSGISMSSAAWRLPMRRRDPILRGVLEGHADGILARLPERNGLALDVQRLLALRIAGGDTRIESVGRARRVGAHAAATAGRGRDLLPAALEDAQGGSRALSGRVAAGDWRDCLPARVLRAGAVPSRVQAASAAARRRRIEGCGPDGGHASPDVCYA
jgi:hypothetical protein